MNRRPYRRSPDGFALVVVLAILASITILVTILTSSSVGHARLIDNYAKSIQQDAVLDSALRVASLKFMNADRGLNSEMMGSLSIAVFGDAVVVSIEHENGRIDINAASESLIYSVFVVSGYSELDARSAAASISKWRESKSFQATSGNGNGSRLLESVNELKGITTGVPLNEEILEAFTVYTHADLPEQVNANPIVTKALEYAEEKRLGGGGWIEPMSNKEGGSAFTTGEIVRMRACLSSAINAVPCRTAVLRFTGKDSSPFQIFQWGA